jgi:threonine 3-dehydrogenase
MEVTMMKAVIKPYQGPGLQLSQVPVPTIGVRDVLIKVKAASICGSDIPIYNWDDPWVRDTIEPGLVVGHEFCGVVVERGEQVHEVVVGDFVTAEGHLNCGSCTHCRRGEAHVCPHLKLVGFQRAGAFAEYIAVPASNVIRLDNVPLIVAAILDAFGNAVHATMTVPLVNTSILVTGCGPVGLMAITLAKLSGARRIIATDVSQYRLNLAMRMGADILLNPATEDVEAVVMEETAADSGVDILLEMSGNPEAIKQGFGLLRPGGQAVLMGLSKQPLLFDFANQIVAKGITVYGVVGRIMYKTWDQVQKLLDQAHNSGTVNLTPLITHRFMVEEFERGMDLMLSGKCGKVILFMDEESMRQSYDEVPG